MKICILSGSGTAAEMIVHTKTVLDAVCKVCYLTPELVLAKVSEEELQEGVPSHETVDLCRTSDAVLFTLQKDGLFTQSYLDALRQKLGLFALMRPIRIFPSALSCAVPKDSFVSEGADILLVQEAFSAASLLPEQGEKVIDGDLCAYDVLLSNSQTAQVTAQSAFQSAAKRSGKVIFTDLNDKMATASLRRRAANLAAADHPEVTLDHLSGCETAAKLTRDPSSMDVVLADPLLGDLLYTQGCALSGLPGVQSAAYFGYGKQGIYFNALPMEEAPRGTACPASLILAMAMALRHSMGLEWEAHCVEKAVAKVLSLGRTLDLPLPTLPTVSSSVFSAYVAQTAAEYISSAE